MLPVMLLKDFVVMGRAEASFLKAASLDDKYALDPNPGLYDWR